MRDIFFVVVKQMMVNSENDENCLVSAVIEWKEKDIEKIELSEVKNLPNLMSAIDRHVNKIKLKYKDRHDHLDDKEKNEIENFYKQVYERFTTKSWFNPPSWCKIS